MKVIVSNNQKTFGELNLADTFVYNNTYFMKIDQIQTLEVYSKYNAVKLEKGYPCFFEDSDIVDVVEMVAVIKR